MNTIAKIKYVKTLIIQHYETGQEARRVRTKMSVSLRSLAKRMEISPAYLHDLEVGRRNWSIKLMRRFEQALTDTGEK